MGFILCTAEKPSVAKDIAAVIGAEQRRNGFFEGNGYLVTWCIGHLVSLCYPESYDEKYSKWSLDTLPIIPSEWKTEIIKTVAAQYKVVKELMGRSDVDYIVDCGDAGTEGCYIQELVRRQAGCHKPVKRLWISSLTKEAILEGFKNLRDIHEFDNVYKAASCRAKADWLVGLNGTRLFSCKYGTRLTCGRVQTPTLAFVVQRYLEVKNFVPTPFYQLQASFMENFSALWTEGDNNRFDSSEEAVQLMNRLMGHDGVIQRLDTTRKTLDRPLLFDITELQREGNRRYGYSAETVLKAAQSLYETHKVTTYPRTDSRYLTSDMSHLLPALVKQIGSIEEYALISEKLERTGLLIDKRLIDDTKVTDHHAIIVTNNIRGFNLGSLSNIESNILHLIITRILTALSPKHVYDEIKLSVDIKGEMFVASGKNPVDIGWRQTENNLLKDSELNEDENLLLFDNLYQGQAVHVIKLELLQKKTQAPKLHTEETLLTAMENAGNSIKGDPALKAILKGHGIGTQATRAGIIEKLISCKYIERTGKGKAPYLVPTPTGLSFVSIMPKELLSPKLTAEWETKLSLITEGKMSEEVFMNEISQFVTELVQNCMQLQDSKHIFDGINNKQSIGVCPRCNKKVFEGDRSFYCEGYKDNPKCEFTIWKNDKFFFSKTGKSITKAQVIKLLEGKGFQAKCIGTKGDYKAIFKLKDNGRYVGFEMSFVKERKK